MVVTHEASTLKESEYEEVSCLAPEPKLSITMLRQLEASPELCDACALEELRTGKTTPQNNIVYRYLW
jgi:hypothetical protein